MRLTPFDYQIQGINDLRTGFAKGNKRGLLAMLMGAGKSLLALELMRLCEEKGNYSLFLTDRRMLTKQIVNVAHEQGLDAGMLLSGEGCNTKALCQFGSKQTIISWLKRSKITLPDFKLLIIDECHRMISESALELFKRWPNAYIVGLTATPCLGNGNGMGKYYDFLVQPIMPSQLKERNRIVPCRAFAPHVPDLKGIKKDKDGDYASKSLSERMTKDNMIGDIAGWWKKLAEDRPSIYFACDVAHAIAIRDEFRNAGVTAELICDETPDEERDQIAEDSKSGKVKIVVNVDVMAEGVDWPWCSCIGLVRPTKRLRRFLQNAGRGMRSCDGKKDCLIIDHSGCVLLHGFPDIDREWPLSSEDNIDDIARRQMKDKKASAPIQCAKCTAVFTGTRKCPECGHEHVWQKQPKDYAKKNGTLIEVTNGTLAPEVSRTLQQRFWATCIGTAIKRRKTAGMSAAMFSGKFGFPPWVAGVSPLPSNPGDWKRPASDVFPGFDRSRK